MKVVVMFFVVCSVVLLCTVKSRYQRAFLLKLVQLWKKSWKATTQVLEKRDFIEKSSRAKKSHLLVPFTQVNTLQKPL